MIFDKFANLKYKYGNRHFWCKRYYVSTVGRNEKKIKEYIQNQLQEDMALDQISMNEYINPFGENLQTKKIPPVKLAVWMVTFYTKKRIL